MSPVPSTLRNGRYTLVETVGSGGMASVHRAWDHRLQVWRAIKLLQPAYAGRPALRARFEAEARAMASLEHPNVVRVVDVDQDGDTLFLVMELLEGGTPADWLQRHGAMPPRLAIDVVLGMCEGVTAAHARGIVHRDLKPQNLLVAADGTVKVTDFGIAQVREGDAAELTRTGVVMGTLGYMAPEQRLDAKSVDHRADLYAIGATLHALCTNRVTIELFAADQSPAVLQGLPPRLAPVVVKACRMEPDARYPTAVALAADLKKLRPTFPALDPSTPPLARPPKAPPPVPSAPAARPSAAPAAATTAPEAARPQGIMPGARSWKVWDGQQPPPQPPTEALFAGPASETQLRPERPAPLPPALEGPPDAEVLVDEPPRIVVCVHLECAPKRRLGHGKPFDAIPAMVDGAAAAAREAALVAEARRTGAAPERLVVRSARSEAAWSHRALVELSRSCAEAAEGCRGCAASTSGAAFGCLTAVPLPLPVEAERWLAEQIRPSSDPGGRLGNDWLRVVGARGRRIDRLRRAGLLSAEGPFERVVAEGWLRSTRVDTSQLLEAMLIPETPSVEPDQCLPPLLLLGAISVRGALPGALTPDALAGLGALPPGAARLEAVRFALPAAPASASGLVGLLRSFHAAWAHGVRVLVVEGPTG